MRSLIQISWQSLTFSHNRSSDLLYYTTFKLLTCNIFNLWIFFWPVIFLICEYFFRECAPKIALTRSIFQPKMHQISFGSRYTNPHFYFTFLPCKTRSQCAQPRTTVWIKSSETVGQTGRRGRSGILWKILKIGAIRNVFHSLAVGHKARFAVTQELILWKLM